jgi:hypothetical protein
MQRSADLPLVLISFALPCTVEESSIRVEYNREHRDDDRCHNRETIELENFAQFRAQLFSILSRIDASTDVTIALISIGFYF